MKSTATPAKIKIDFKSLKDKQTFAALSLSDQCALIRQDRGIFFKLPQELITQTHVEQVVAQFRDYLAQTLRSVSGKHRKNASKLWAGDYLLKTLLHAPQKTHTSQMIIQAATGRLFFTDSYVPTEMNTAFPQVFKPFLKNHILMSESLAEDLVSTSPWLIFSMQDEYVTDQLKALAAELFVIHGVLPNGGNMNHLNRRQIQLEEYIDNCLKSDSNKSKKLILDRLEFLAYDKSLDKNPAAMKRAWDDSMKQIGLHSAPWDELSDVEQVKVVFKVIALSGANSKSRRTLYPLISGRISGHNDIPVANELPSHDAAVQPVEIVQSTQAKSPSVAPTPAPAEAPKVALPTIKPVVRPMLVKAQPKPATSAAIADKTLTQGTLPFIDPEAEKPALKVKQLSNLHELIEPGKSKEIDSAIHEANKAECTFVLLRSRVIGIASVKPSVATEPSINYQFLYEEKSRCYSLIRQQGDLFKLYECTPEGEQQAPTLTVESRDQTGRRSVIGHGVVRKDEIYFKFIGQSEFSLVINKDNHPLEKLNTTSVTRIKQPYWDQSTPTESPSNEADGDFTLEDIERLRGILPMPIERKRY